jgi:hypothetical protein
VAEDAEMEPACIPVFAETNWRNQHQVFGVRQDDRRHHTCVIGKTGTGKSTLLPTQSDRTLSKDAELRSLICTAALFDLHGDLVERVTGGNLPTNPKES